jgi:hypothetical protein
MGARADYTAGPEITAAGRANPATGARKMTRWRTWHASCAGSKPGARTRPGPGGSDAGTFLAAALSASSWVPGPVMPSQ